MLRAVCFNCGLYLIIVCKLKHGDELCWSTSEKCCLCAFLCSVGIVGDRDASAAAGDGIVSHFASRGHRARDVVYADSTVCSGQRHGVVFVVLCAADDGDGSVFGDVVDEHSIDISGGRREWSGSAAASVCRDLDAGWGSIEVSDPRYD